LGLEGAFSFFLFISTGTHELHLRRLRGLGKFLLFFLHWCSRPETGTLNFFAIDWHFDFLPIDWYSRLATGTLILFISEFAERGVRKITTVTLAPRPVRMATGTLIFSLDWHSQMETGTLIFLPKATLRGDHHWHSVSTLRLAFGSKLFLPFWSRLLYHNPILCPPPTTTTTTIKGAFKGKKG